jgi:type I restriction-modification system DNA methylase subunit
MAKAQKARKRTTNGANLGFEARLWATADKLRGNMEPSDYKHVALGLIFLKYISNAFEAKREALLAEELAIRQTLGLDGINTDAAVPGLNRNNTYRLPVAWSHESIRAAFDEIVTLMRKKMCSNADESRTLAQTRDLLLPKLMSGEIRLREAEKLMEAVA